MIAGRASRLRAFARLPTDTDDLRPPPPTAPLAVLAHVTGADRTLPWPGLAVALCILAATRALAVPGVAKLMVALLMPVLAGWLAGWLAPRVTVERQRWTPAWVWAIAAQLVGMIGTVTLYYYLAMQRDLIAFPLKSQMMLSTLVWGGTLAMPLAIRQRVAWRTELAALRLSAVSAELKALQAQVEPHFLYNTLANTRYLARHQPERAVAMLDHLIAYLRGALPDMRTRASTVRRECDLAHHYLSVMAIRFGERLRHDVEVDDDVAGAELPPLLLISLVENAVRHGVEPVARDVRVRVRASRAHIGAGERLRVTVGDDGPGPGQTGPIGNGVGLRNVAERLRALYGDAAGVTLTRSDDGVTVAEILLPFRPGREAPAPVTP